jgi:hypothetical protein
MLFQKLAADEAIERPKKAAFWKVVAVSFQKANGI